MYASLVATNSIKYLEKCSWFQNAEVAHIFSWCFPSRIQYATIFK